MSNAGAAMAVAATEHGTEITERQCQAFRRDGFLVCRGMFGPERMASVTRWVDALQAMPETPGGAMFYYEDHVRDASQRVLSRIEYFADFHAELGALMRGPEMCGRVSTLFGAPAILFKEKVNLKLPGGQGFEPHQDVQAGWAVYGARHTTMMISIDPATKQNGCLELVAGHHEDGLIGEMWKPLSESDIADLHFEKLPTDPGDVVFFDSFAPHRSAPNLSTLRRRILYVTYGLAEHGDHRERYFAEKRANFPPDIEREPGKNYAYKV